MVLAYCRKSLKPTNIIQTIMLVTKSRKLPSEFIPKDAIKMDTATMDKTIPSHPSQRGSFWVRIIAMDQHIIAKQKAKLYI
jgi:hypothetical protein